MDARSIRELAKAIGGKVIGEVPENRGAEGIAGLVAFYQRFRGRSPSASMKAEPASEGESDSVEPAPGSATRPVKATRERIP